jgi:hypothetical protein
MRKLKNQYAKGGSTRRTAMFEANELMAGERAMRTRVQETWQANLALYDTVRQNADRVAAGTASFMAGLPLVNDSYRDAMQRTAQLQIQASGMANNAIMSAYDTKMTQQPVNWAENFVEGLIGTVGSIAMSYVTGGAASYLGGGGFNEGGLDSILGKTDSEGNRTGGTLTSGGNSSNLFTGASNQGYTQRNTGNTAAYTSSGTPDWMDTVLKSGLSYLNTIGDDDATTYGGGDQSDDTSVASRYGAG